jgi:hypothetical protein
VEEYTIQVCPRCRKTTLEVGCVDIETDQGAVEKTLTKSCTNCGYPKGDANEVGFDVVKRATEGR